MSPNPRGAATVRSADWLFRVYKRALSPLLHTLGPSRCKFLPTCSEYAYVAVVRHGSWRGSMLALWRFLRCHPFSAGGFDPVPSPGESKAQHLS